MPPDHAVVAALEQNIVLMLKTVGSTHSAGMQPEVIPFNFILLQLLDVQSHHPIGYVSFLLPSLELIYSFVFNPSNEGELVFAVAMEMMSSGLCSIGQLFDRFVICALNLLREIVQCEDYTPLQNIRLTEGK